MEEQSITNSYKRLSSDYSFAYNIFLQITPYLDYKDLVSCSEVCTVWNSVVKTIPFWSSYCMSCCGYHLDQILNKNDLLFRKAEFSDVEKTHVQNHENILSAALDLEELTLVQCHFNFNEKLTSILKNLKVLKITQAFGREEFDNPYTKTFFHSLVNLTELSISTSLPVSLDALEELNQLEHLFIDANYSKGFFKTSSKLVTNLESFGVGFTSHKEKPKIINRYKVQFCEILVHMKNMKKLLLYGLDNDFSILRTVARLEQLETLELGLIRAWNHYSSFLSMCCNVKKLYVKLILPRGRYLNVEEVAAHNSILFGSVKELRDSLTEFTWVFDKNYIKESEQVLALQNDKWETNFTAIWNNIVDFQPQNFTQPQLVTMAQERDVSGVYLKNLEEMLSKELPSTKVRVISEKSKNCEFCPTPVDGEINLHFVRILRKDRLRAHWIHSRFRNKQNMNE